ncbi:MAG: cobyric acid synthase, partial [Acidobacteria bacterium]|nr:cobyric acid synthase [Acidobacteriota bacterium]
MSARPLFIGGTSSNAGKSWMATAVCAWLRSKGVSVAPFKAQNMSNNSYPCAHGGEIGRAQVAQAEACGLEPEPAMNPILLKPAGNGTSQVIVHGRMWKTLSAREYYAHAGDLRPRVIEAYRHLAGRFDVVVIEGAGSVSELNLRQ